MRTLWSIRHQNAPGRAPIGTRRHLSAPASTLGAYALARRVKRSGMRWRSTSMKRVPGDVPLATVDAL